MGFETEAAFDIADRATARRLRAAADIARMPLENPRVRRLRDTYLDTSRQSLRRAGWALRRREEAGRITLELKSLDAPREWIRRRREITVDLPSLLPPEQWPAGELHDTVDHLRGEAPLVPLFVVHQVRRARTVRRGRDTVAELSLDTVEVNAHGCRRRFRVLEVEKLPGAGRRDLAALIRALRSQPGLVPATASKYERGLSLARRARRAAAVPGPLVLAARGDLSLDAVLEELAALGYATQVSDGPDTPCDAVPGCQVTSLRVVARTPGAPSLRLLLRSWILPSPLDELPPARALTVSLARRDDAGTRYLARLLSQRLPLAPRRGDDGAPPSESAHDRAPGSSAAAVGAQTVRAGARRLQEHLAGARIGDDPEHVHEMRVACRRARFALKLFDGMMGPWVSATARVELAWMAAQLGAVRDLDVLVGRLDHDLERAGADERFAASLRSALAGRRGVAMACLRDALASARCRDLVTMLGETAPRTADTPVKADAVPFVREAVRRAAVRVVKAVRRLDPADAAGLHRLRILVKRLRYTADILVPLDRGHARKIVRAAARLQRALGASQDAAVGERILRGLVAERLDLAAEPSFLAALDALQHVQREALETARERIPRLWRSFGGPVRKAAK